jgi:large subunit ribosomal protein L9
MKVILLERVRNLGDMGDQVNVKPGYGRNYLIPQGKAVAATAGNIEVFESQRAELEKAAADKLAQAEKNAAALADLVVSIAMKAGDEGKLFGSVGPREVARAITEAGTPVEKRHVVMSEGPIRQTGEHSVDLILHTDVVAKIQLNVVPAKD